MWHFQKMPKRPHMTRTTAAEERIPFRERITCSISDPEAVSGVSRSQLYLEMKIGNLEYIKRGARRLVRVS
jgi:hypothetical protein